MPDLATNHAADSTSAEAARPWRITIDTGGTFTDCLAVSPSGDRRRIKVLSSGRLRGRLESIDGSSDSQRRRLVIEPPPPPCVLCGAHVSDSHGSAHVVSVDDDGIVVLDAIPDAWLRDELRLVEIDAGCSAPRLAMAIAVAESPQSITASIDLRIATTRGTNALLERRVGRVALFVTAGFEDLHAIGDQTRRDLFALAIAPRRPLPQAILPIPARLAADGREVLPLDETALETSIRAARREGFDTAAVAVMHSHLDPTTEHRVATLLAKHGFARIVCSSDLSRRAGFLERTQAVAVDAALDATIRDFLREIARPLERISIRAMTSDGRLADADRYPPVESLLSGPAAGAMGVRAIAASLGLGPALGFDMGGTSTDVVRVDGELPVSGRTEVGDIRLASPCVAIETVAAGGGSICGCDAEGRLFVGPESAGADPGPACYGRGGPLTVTDVNLLLGRVDETIFGVPLVEHAARSALEGLLDRLAAIEGSRPDADSILDRLLAIADERMAGAIETVSTRQGFDPSDHAIIAFGGAGGQHAAAIAERLGVGTIAFPADAGILSAVGLDHATLATRAERTVHRPLEAVEAELEAMAEALDSEACAALGAQGVSSEAMSPPATTIHLRLHGQDEAIELPLDPRASLRKRFAEGFAHQYGYAPPDRPIEVAILEARRAERRSASHSWPSEPAAPTSPPHRVRPMRHAGRWIEASIHRREALRAGNEIHGPAILADRTSTAILPPGWTGEVRRDGSVIARSHGTRSRRESAAFGIELFTARLASIAEEMGERLRRTSLSVNIKHRLDFSCAILDGDGRLAVNAAHLPVHLGALGIAARSVLAALPLAPGDVVVTNHPAFGGSHLPDVTLLTPIFACNRGRPIAILANRAHHAEIGGIRPGSMAPSARCLAEEGVEIPPTKLIEAGTARWDRIERIFREAPWPSRSLDDNLADLAAQVAANHRGAVRLGEVVREIGADRFRELLDGMSSHGLATLRSVLPSLLPEPRHARIELDDGTPIEVSLRLESRGEGQSPSHLVVDFSGSGGTHPRNLNAPVAIVHAAVLYVLRAIIGPSIPLHEGLMQAVELRVPMGILNPPFSGDASRDPAVAAGNTETSQRIVECLLAAFGVVAASQGTMNNTLLGNDRFGMYETLCGGSGAGPGFDGASAVHTHMTNTRIGDPEFIESRYPIRIERFEIRRGSGGTGAHRGGDGVRRVYEALAPLSACVVAEHRRLGPPGAHGGDAGLPGSQRVIRGDGVVETLDGAAEVELAAGDRLEVLTPGGGGWGGSGET